MIERRVVRRRVAAQSRRCAVRYRCGLSPTCAENFRRNSNRESPAVRARSSTRSGSAYCVSIRSSALRMPGSTIGSLRRRAGPRTTPASARVRATRAPGRSDRASLRARGLALLLLQSRTPVRSRSRSSPHRRRARPREPRPRDRARRRLPRTRTRRSESALNERRRCSWRVEEPRRKKDARAGGRDDHPLAVLSKRELERPGPDPRQLEARILVCRTDPRRATTDRTGGRARTIPRACSGETDARPRTSVDSTPVSGRRAPGTPEKTANATRRG